jgi:predicted ribosomally synthesized peptide with nif11-like leader
MSVENLKKYGKLCAEDGKIREKAKEIGTQDLDGHIAHAKTLGLDISREDFAALAKEAGIDGKDELSEEDLKKVAGGIITITAFAMIATIGAVTGAGVAAAVSKPGW